MGIVILNWQNAADTLICLDSVLDLDYPAFRVLVVDNGSRDDSVEQIKHVHPEVDVLALSDNHGFAEGNNYGILRELELGADYVLVLNNDTTVAPNMLRRLVERALSDSSIGMLGPKMYCVEPEGHLFAAGSFVDWASGSLVHRGMFEPETSVGRIDLAEDVDFIVGCGVLVSREFCQRVGLFDPIYYLNYEDVEWGVRGRRAGYRVVYEPSAVMWHRISATLGRSSPANTYYMTRNALLFFWKNAAFPTKLVSICSIVARTIRSTMAWSLRERYRDEVHRRKKMANLFALRDFLRGRGERMPDDVAAVCYGERLA